MYYYGDGVPQDNVLAYVWSSIASSLGHENAKENIGIIQNEMTSAEITKAQELSNECLNSNYQKCE